MSAARPKIDRSFTLHMMGDWGRANLHKALGWLTTELGELSGPHTRFAIWNGTGALDNIRAVGRGEMDLCMTTPAAFARMAYEGLGPCANERFPHLRAIGSVPQNDRMIFAIRSEFGICSFDDLRRKKPALRIVAGPDDGINFMGMGAHELMKASGVDRKTIETWGGSYIDFPDPMRCCDAFVTGKADAIIQEAVMTPWWTKLAEKIDVNFLPIEPAARDTLLKTLGWPSRTLPAGYLRGMDTEMEFLDFSDFLLIAREDLPEDVAHALAWCLIERWEGLEVQYRHIPSRSSPVTYPIDPRAACRTPIPLHRGAEAYFRAAGHL